MKFSEPSFVGNELENVSQAVRNGHIAMSGPYTDEVERLLETAIGSRRAILTTSCTDALEMAAMLLKIGPGDTVIVPSFTFVSTALAFARQGATIRFADIEPRTLGMCPESMESLLDESVRAVIPVHYAGIACEIDGLEELRRAHGGFEIVEDNAHGLFGSYRGTPLGSFGRMSTLSFHETKNFTCGEGGALLLNDEADIAPAEILRDKGTNRSAFMHGVVDRYSWVGEGSSFGLSDILAAYLFAQLERRVEVLDARAEIARNYDTILRPVALDCGFELPVVPSDRLSAFHMYYVLLPDKPTRDAVISGMRRRGVSPAFHYVPLHSSPGGLEAARGRVFDCPVSEETSDRLLRLPYFTAMTPQQTEIAATSFLESLAEVPQSLAAS